MEIKNVETEEEVKEKELLLVESALYVSGRPIGLRMLGRILGTRSKDRILKIAETLVEKYKMYNCALEVIEVKKHRFVMQVKIEYSQKVRKLSMQSV